MKKSVIYAAVPESKAGKMIHIPNNICICNDCMQKTFDSMNNTEPEWHISKYALYGYVRIWYSQICRGGDNIPENQKIKKKKAAKEKKKDTYTDRCL